MSRKVLCVVIAGLVGAVVGCGKSPDPAPSAAAEAVTVKPGKPAGKVGFGEQ